MVGPVVLCVLGVLHYVQKIHAEDFTENPDKQEHGNMPISTTFGGPSMHLYKDKVKAHYPHGHAVAHRRQL